MPLFDYRCEAGHVHEDLFMGATIPRQVMCPVCRGPAQRVTVVLIADTKARWGDSHSYYDGQLGCTIRNSAHKDQVLSARGLVPESQLASGTADSLVQNSINDAKQHEPDVSKYSANLKDNGGDVGMALAETFTADRMGIAL